MCRKNASEGERKPERKGPRVSIACGRQVVRREDIGKKRETKKKWGDEILPKSTAKRVGGNQKKKRKPRARPTGVIAQNFGVKNQSQEDKG